MLSTCSLYSQNNDIHRYFVVYFVYNTCTNSFSYGNTPGPSVFEFPLYSLLWFSMVLGHVRGQTLGLIARKEPGYEAS